MTENLGHIKIDNQNLIGMGLNPEGRVSKYYLSNGRELYPEDIHMLHRQGKVEGMTSYQNGETYKIEPTTPEAYNEYLQYLKIVTSKTEK